MKTLDDDAIGARFQDLDDRLRQPGADVTGGLARTEGHVADAHHA